MNLSVLERMAREGDMSADALQYFLSCKGECEWLDFKQILHVDNDHELGAFAKDVLAIKNTGGGFIVVGVTDKTWVPCGIPSPLPYDAKLLRDKVRKATGLDLEVDIVHHELHADGAPKHFAVILVRSSKKRKRRRTPSVVHADFCPTKPYGLRRGDIFVRKGDSTAKLESAEELSDLLDALEAQADEDAVTASGALSPFAVEEGLYRLLEKGFEQFVGRNQLRSDLLKAVTQDPRLWIINVHGPGGVGKSALVSWCVYELYQSRNFEAIIHLTAKETVLTTTGIEQHSRCLYSVENLLDHVLQTFGEKPPERLEDKRNIAIDYLSAWKTLLVLDNMETVQDGRILTFIQSLPPTSQTKVILTSRSKSGGWELPIPVSEMNQDEVTEFLRIRRGELSIAFPVDDTSVRRVCDVTGGLPLAVQWVMGTFRLTGNFEKATSAVSQKDSPVLEFSFRNIWQMLSQDARVVLAVASIFNDPPTAQQFSLTIEWPIDRVERALAELAEVTLMTRTTHHADGRVTYVALPITLAFARHQLGEMGELEVDARRRHQRFTDQMDLHRAELTKFQSRFDKYGLETDFDRRAAILCQRGESEMFIGNVDNASMLFKQARDLAPRSSYVYAMYASFELARNHLGEAMQLANQACERATSRTGGLCYTIKARICQAQRDRAGRTAALAKAVEYEPNDPVVRHQYGVAHSINGQPEQAIEQFSIIIESERGRETPGLQLLVALNTRMINLKRLHRDTDLDADLQVVKDILIRYPHLAGEAHRFSEFVDELAHPIN